MFDARLKNNWCPQSRI